MNETDINALLQKADELKALFILGQRVIPFLEEIFIFVKDIKPMLDEINVSIKENLKKMPNASKQLSKVTEATEMATNEIMDIVDGLVYKSDIIGNNLKRMTEIDAQKTSSPVKILEIINNAIKDDTDINELMPAIKAAIEEMREGAEPEYSELVDGTNELLQSIQNDSSSIMMSLQVQDITSQQIAAVNHLLETIQSKLNSIMSKFKSTEISDLMTPQGGGQGYHKSTNVSTLHRNIAFDPEAVEAISMKESRQNQVDEMIQTAEDNIDMELASSDDIDALFNNVGEDSATEEEAAPPEPENNNVAIEEEPAPSIEETTAPAEEEIEDGDEEISQDDIDALFG